MHLNCSKSTYLLNIQNRQDVLSNLDQLDGWFMRKKNWVSKTSSRGKKYHKKVSEQEVFQ